jgi:hypothetical protein
MSVSQLHTRFLGLPEKATGITVETKHNRADRIDVGSIQ